jgi:hypothetical protein
MDACVCICLCIWCVLSSLSSPPRPPHKQHTHTHTHKDIHTHTHTHIHTPTPRPSPNLRKTSGCIASVVEELELHSSLGVAHHVAENRSPPSPACDAYTSFLLAVASDPASTVAQVSSLGLWCKLHEGRCAWYEMSSPGIDQSPWCSGTNVRSLPLLHQVLAAMCPCMRLYAYLAQTMQYKLPINTTPRPASLQVRQSINQSID